MTNIKMYIKTINVEAKKHSLQINEFTKLYKFELLLIACVLTGTINEALLYSSGQSALIGLVWLLPIYGLYKNQLKNMGAKNC